MNLNHSYTCIVGGIINECGMSSEDAHDILFPPLEEGEDFDYVPNANLAEWMVE